MDETSEKDPGMEDLEWICLLTELDEQIATFGEGPRQCKIPKVDWVRQGRPSKIRVTIPVGNEFGGS